MNKYNQLSQENRYQIAALLKEGLNQTQIASNIGVHRSTISRELTRNVTNEPPPATATGRMLPSSSPTGATLITPTTDGLAKTSRIRPAGG